MSLLVNIRKHMGNFSLNVQFESGNETLALLGASGCGKSVTLRCIAGILCPDEGHIELDGQVLFDSAAHINLPPQKRKIGYLFQQYALFPNMTVRQNITVAVTDKSRKKEVTVEKLQQFHLTDVADMRPRQLSGGQQQRAALARILASDPRAILLDEPFAALDSYLKYQLELELQNMLGKFSGTVLWVSHDRGEVWRNCQRVCVIDRGISEPVVTMQELFCAPKTESAARLSGCKNYVAVVPDGNTVRIPQWNLILQCGKTVPPYIRIAGIRSHCIRIADGTEKNQMVCTVIRVIDDVLGTIVLLKPIDAAPDAPLLRMELSKRDWAARTISKNITVAVAPQDILLLRQGGIHYEVQSRSAYCQ